MSDDAEIVRKALMMRDAGYGEPTHIWEQVGGLLKEYDRLRAELAETQAVLLVSAATGARYMDRVTDLRAELAGLQMEHDSVIRGWQDFEKRTNAAARQDAAEIERLREALDKISTTGWRSNGGDARVMKELALAALAPRPQEDKPW